MLGRLSQREGDRGVVYHAAKDFYGSSKEPALCGVKPGRRSVGWSTAGRNVTCPRCLKRMPPAVMPVEL
jgi:transposase